MKRLITLFALSVVVLATYGEVNNMELQDFKEIKSAGGLENLSTKFMEEWPNDGDGRPCAWIRVKFENMTYEEMEQVQFKVSASSDIVYDNPKQVYQEEHERWLFVKASEKAYIYAYHAKYGTTDNVTIRLVEKGVYDVTLVNNRTVSITVDAKVDGADVRIKELGLSKKSTPKAVFEGIPMGDYTLVVSKNGIEKYRDSISVSETNTFFEADARDRKELTITSDPSGASVYINGKKQNGKTPLNVTLPHDTYTFRVELRPDQYDEKSININSATENTISFEPIEKQRFEVVAMYNGSKVNADLYINNELEGRNSSSYQLYLPTGKTYHMRMSYFGNSKEKKVKVSKGMGEQIFKIPTRSSFVWPWQREYQSAPFGFTVGYVQKQLSTDDEGYKVKENGVWYNGEDKWLSGVQVGFRVQPCFSWGLGLYTGLYYEYYFSSNGDPYGDEYSDFEEHCIYLPAHVLFRLPFAEKVALQVHGGLGFNYSVSGRYYEDGYDDYSDFYGEDGCPKRFNMTLEVGVGFRVGPVQINAQYGLGLTDHESYASVGDYSTKQNKMTLSASWVFSTGY